MDNPDQNSQITTVFDSESQTMITEEEMFTKNIKKLDSVISTLLETVFKIQRIRNGLEHLDYQDLQMLKLQTDSISRTLSPISEVLDDFVQHLNTTEETHFDYRYTIPELEAISVNGFMINELSKIIPIKYKTSTLLRLLINVSGKFSKETNTELLKCIYNKENTNMKTIEACTKIFNESKHLLSEDEIEEIESIISE